MGRRYCEKCGAAISIDAVYCSSCGVKQSEISNSVIKEDVSKETRIDVPSGHHFCAYCGEVKPDGDFWTLYDNEFCMCNKCHQRESKIYHAVVVSASIIALFFIALFTIDAELNDFAVMDYLDNHAGVFLNFILISLLVFAVFHNPIYDLLIKEILKHTSWRVSLSKKREEWLRECKDVNGNSIVVPVKRTIEENSYREITGVYLSRDVPNGYFICPCCEKLHQLSYSVSVNSEDNEHKPGSRFIGGAYIQRTTIEYGSLVCPDCYKLKKTNKRLRIIVPIILVLIALAVVTLVYYDVLKNDELGLVIFGMTAGALIAGFLLSVVVSFVYKLCVYIFTRKKLFYRYQDAAKYGALTTRQ